MTHPCPISPAEARDLFRYELLTGLLFFRSGPNAGAQVGFADASGYLKVKVAGKLLAVHRIVWLMSYDEWPPGIVDHADGNALNNTLSNLRLASKSQNSMNAKTPCTNTTGFKGVRARGSKFNAQIKFNGKKYSLGNFDTPELAHAAYRGAAKVLFGEFARMQ
jgi:hypothetical protein